MSGSGDFIVELMPERSLELLSQQEVNRLRDTSAGGQYEIFRRCAIAVLSVGAETDDAQAVLDRHKDFRISIVPEFRGLKLALHNPPAGAFVDGHMVRGIRELLAEPRAPFLAGTASIVITPKEPIQLAG